MGYNSFPRGINDNVPDRQVRPFKYKWFAHAEENAINNAALIGVSLKAIDIFGDLSLEDSQERCRSLDEVHNAYSNEHKDNEWFTSITRQHRNF